MFMTMRLYCRRGGQDRRREKKKQQNDALSHGRVKTLSHHFVKSCGPKAGPTRRLKFFNGVKRRLRF
jgi:hypothetical protein